MSMDARQVAAAILRQLNKTELEDEFFCYGNADRILVGIEKKHSLKIVYPVSFERLWQQTGDFLAEYRDEYIMGFIGFDPANQLNQKNPEPGNKIDLFIPKIVIECTRNDFRILRGKPDKNDLDTYFPQSFSEAVDINNYDDLNSKAAYLQSVENLLDKIHDGLIERATLARKIKTDIAFDLVSSFLSDHSRHNVSRNFLFSNESIAFAGQSPELLAEGNKEFFFTHKLSGTYAYHAEMKSKQKQKFSNDKRIVNEHSSAIKSIESSLNFLGQVESVKFKVMELPSLLHGWSEFKTAIKTDKTIADCLRAVFPFGVNPVKPSFEFISKHENFSRGPYYGLAGLIEPDGRFSFTQVLRTAFTDRENSYVMVGAAITAHSTAETELLETSTKLNGVSVYKKLFQDEEKKVLSR